MPVKSIECILWRIQDFPEGSPTPGFGGHQSTVYSVFLENCMKMKKSWPRRGRVSLAAPRSVTGIVIRFERK